MRKYLLIALLCCLLGACTTTSYHNNMTPKMMSELQQGKRFFEEGYYKRAMHLLLPLACDGVAEAQYAVGYMYYYGYGVAQDIEVGYFWIKRSADQGYVPAEKALDVIMHQDNKTLHENEKR